MAKSWKWNRTIVSGKLKGFIFVSFLLMVVLFLFFGKSLLPGHVLSGADGAFSTPFFDEAKPLGFTEPSNSLLFDQIYQFTPWRYFAWKSLNEGQLPLWNPYSSAGTPFIATMQSAVFYPINLLLTLTPFEYTLAWSALIRLWVAGICTYLLARNYELGRIAALISSVSFMLSGFLVVWLGHPHTNVAIWLPALILLAELLLQARQKSQLLFIMGLLGLTVGVQFTGGHIETSVDVVFAVGLYYILRWTVIILPQGRPLISKLQYLTTVPIVLFSLGAAVAAVQLAPFLEWLSIGAEFKKRGGFATGFHLIDPSSWQHLLELPVILFPNLYNNPTWNEFPYWSFLPWGGNYNENILYVGTLTLVLALIGIWSRWKDTPLVRIWSIIGLIALGRAFHLPGFDWLNHLPILSLEQPDRLRLISSFCLCILAGFGAQTLWNTDLARQPLVRKLWVWSSIFIMLMGLIILLLGNAVLPTISEKITAYGRERVNYELSKRDTPPQYPMEHYYAEVDQMVGGLMAAFHFKNTAMYMPMFWAFVGLLSLSWFWRQGSVSVVLQKIILLALVTMDLLSFGRNYNPSLPVEQLYPVTSSVKQIKKDKTLFRFTALRHVLIPDAHMMFGLQDVRGLDFPTHWYNQYMNLVPERIPWLNYGIIIGSVDSPLLQVLNIKYIVASRTDMLETNENIMILDNPGEVYLGEMINVSPRAFMVYDTVITGSSEEAADILRSAPDSIFDRVVLSDGENGSPLLLKRHNGNPNINTVDSLSYEASHSEWRVYTNEDGYLFLSDTYYPGWNAYLDDQPTELYRANIAFRAVYVPEGEHVISFDYEPASIRLGAVISIVSLTMILLLLIWTHRGMSKPDTVESKAVY